MFRRSAVALMALLSFRDFSFPSLRLPPIDLGAPLIVHRHRRGPGHGTRRGRGRARVRQAPAGVARRKAARKAKLRRRRAA
jgi:hypothetical protein